MEEFLESNGIESVLDIGCGYREYADYKDWAAPLKRYHGVDLVDVPISACKVRFGACNNYVFSVGDGFCDVELSQYDLVVVKDVFNHLPLNCVREKLLRLNECRCALLVHDYVPNLPNGEIVAGDSRPIDPTRFDVGKPVLTFFWNSKGVWLMCQDLSRGRLGRLRRQLV